MGDDVAGGDELVIWGDRFLDALEPVLAKHRDSKARRESLVFRKALRLSGGSLDVMETLLRGEIVPRSKLDAKWAKAYGIK